MPLQLLEGMSSRKRRPNWTDQECLLLVQLLRERKEVIRGKCSTGISVQDKRQAWEEITQAINAAFPEIQRTVSDCNKKWENMLAKSREEIKRQKRQADEGLSLDEFSYVTQVVISLMNLSNFLQRDQEDSAASDLVESQQTSCDKDGNSHKSDDSFTHKRPRTNHELPTCSHPSTFPGEQKTTALTNFPKSLTMHFSTPNAAGFASSGELADSPCSSSAPSTALQERMDLEMSVLRRQDAVLKLQEEYYTLKIKRMKKQMQEPL